MVRTLLIALLLSGCASSGDGVVTNDEVTMEKIEKSRNTWWAHIWACQMFPERNKNLCEADGE